MPILLGSGIIDLGFYCGLVLGTLQLEGNRKWEMGKTGWSSFGSRKCVFSPDSGMGGRSTWKRRHQSVNGSSERSIFIDFFYPWHHGQLVVVMNKVALSTSY